MTGTTTSSTSDLAAITEVLRRGQDAWNAGDGAAYGACFTDDATDVTFVGTVYHGAAEIGRAHQALFDSFLKDTLLTIEIVEIRRYGDAAVVLTRGEVAKGAPKKLGKLATYTLVRQAGGQWRIAAVQKTKHKPLMETVSFTFQPATRPSS
ncbi:YybH family protein [Nonomuraea wenchangensis]|uniref:DUF4440 domain-containing protein n=1 Tax=Nonomuraea wenchangensis TaxID=568860 RepID=A0A1H9YR65_9ACTN|nr:SgcJ/EcaC family oxidoreductase [Nonomuraea wenchangensis]SES70993.1 conserved hypothetical protein [Nonomuraea wenchangensis]